MRRLLVISLLFLSLAAAAQSKHCLPRAKEYPFCSGETFSLSLTYKWGAVQTEVGVANVALDSVQFKGKQTYHTAFTVKSAPFFDIFFKMRESFHSWFTVDGLRPLRFTRDTFEGGYTAVNDYAYDWDQNVIHANVNFENRGEQTLDIPLHDCVYDLPAMIYYLRAADFSKMVPGQVYPLSFAIDDAVFDIRLTYKGIETLKVRKWGKTRVRRFSCSVVSGAMFEGNQELQFWLSADDACLPVAVMAPLRIGAVWAWIRSVDQLKHPFSAVMK